MAVVDCGFAVLGHTNTVLSDVGRVFRGIELSVCVRVCVCVCVTKIEKIA